MNFGPRYSVAAPVAVGFSLEAKPARNPVTCLSRDRVVALENAILNEGLPLFDPPITNHFSEGVYGREMFMPAGTVLTGKIHKFSNMNVLLEGEVLVSTDKGIEHVKAGFMIVAPAGAKRVFYALTDARWLTIHGTHKTDVSEIEAEFIAQDEQEFVAFCNDQLKLERDSYVLG